MITATTDDLQTYLGASATLPDEAERLLLTAGDLIDYAIRVPFDENDQEQKDAVIKAQCAQVEYWMNVDESIDIVGPPRRMQVFGSFDVEVKMSILAPRAARVLRMVGLLTNRVRMGGRRSLADQFFDPYDNGRRMNP